MQRISKQNCFKTTASDLFLWTTMSVRKSTRESAQPSIVYNKGNVLGIILKVFTSNVVLAHWCTFVMQKRLCRHCGSFWLKNHRFFLFWYSTIFTVTVFPVKFNNVMLFFALFMDSLTHAIFRRRFKHSRAQHVALLNWFLLY